MIIYIINYQDKSIAAYLDIAHAMLDALEVYQKYLADHPEIQSDLRDMELKLSDLYGISLSAGGAITLDDFAQITAVPLSDVTEDMIGPLLNEVVS